MLNEFLTFFFCRFGGQFLRPRTRKGRKRVRESLLHHARHSSGGLISGGLVGTSGAALSLLRESRDDLVNAEEHASGFNGSLERLDLDRVGFEQVDVAHIDNLTGLTVNSNVGVLSLSVLGSQLGESSDDIGAAVLDEGAGDDFEGESESSVGVLSDARNRL